MTPTVRPMRWWDVEAVLPLERELFSDDTWSARIFWSELAQPSSRHYVVATDDAGSEAVVGYAGLAVFPDEAHVLTLGVRTDRQGSGVGGLLLRDLLGAAEQRGTRRVLLEVRAGNTAAEHLYTRHGFVPVGVRKRYYQPSGADAVVMVRDG